MKREQEDLPVEGIFYFLPRRAESGIEWVFEALIKDPVTVKWPIHAGYWKKEIIHVLWSSWSADEEKKRHCMPLYRGIPRGRVVAQANGTWELWAGKELDAVNGWKHMVFSKFNLALAEQMGTFRLIRGSSENCRDNDAKALEAVGIKWKQDQESAQVRLAAAARLERKKKW